jgi:hypothetical protein
VERSWISEKIQNGQTRGENFVDHSREILAMKTFALRKYLFRVRKTEFISESWIRPPAKFDTGKDQLLGNLLLRWFRQKFWTDIRQKACEKPWKTRLSGERTSKCEKKHTVFHPSNAAGHFHMK